MDKYVYDLAACAAPELKELSQDFTQAQYTLICQTVAAHSLALLQQYHQWLAERLQP